MTFVGVGMSRSRSQTLWLMHRIIEGATKLVLDSLRYCGCQSKMRFLYNELETKGESVASGAVRRLRFALGSKRPGCEWGGGESQLGQRIHLIRQLSWSLLGNDGKWPMQ